MGQWTVVGKNEEQAVRDARSHYEEWRSGGQRETFPDLLIWHQQMKFWRGGQLERRLWAKDTWEASATVNSVSPEITYIQVTTNGPEDCIYIFMNRYICNNNKERETMSLRGVAWEMLEREEWREMMSWYSKKDAESRRMV